MGVGDGLALVEDLSALEPPASLEPAYAAMLGSLEALVAAMREQTKAAVAGSRERVIEATDDVELAFDELGEAASDTGRSYAPCRSSASRRRCVD